MTLKDIRQTTPDVQDSLIDRLENELHRYAEAGVLSLDTPDLVPVWQKRTREEPGRFIRSDSTIDAEALSNFRRDQIFVTDSPRWNTHTLNIFSRLKGGRRGTAKMLQECLGVLKDNEYDHFLRKYPCSPVGNPHVYEYQGYRFTFRWFKHIYFLGLMDRVLRQKLDPGFVTIDVGSSYGIFSSLVKQEWPDSHHVLVDFPEQLLLAYYFLSTTFPDAKIAGASKVLQQETITRDLIEGHDFTLVPISHYQKLAAGSVDLVANFASFGEMDRKWFDHYLDSDLFRSADYLFTANRVQSYPHYDTDLSIQDYPVYDREKTFHFGISPAFGGYYRYDRKNLFFYERHSYPAYFEYIGII